jgi:hypothetical protein
MEDIKVVKLENGDFQKEYTPTSELVTRASIEEQLNNLKAQMNEAIEKYNKYLAEIGPFLAVDDTLGEKVLTLPVPEIVEALPAEAVVER